MSKTDKWQKKLKILENRRTSARTELKLVDRQLEDLNDECEKFGTTPDEAKDKLRELDEEKGALESKIERMFSRIEKDIGDIVGDEDEEGEEGNVE